MNEIPFSRHEAAASGDLTKPRLHFENQGLPRAEQFKAWQAFWAPMAEIQPIAHPGFGFRARQVVWDLGSIALATINTPPNRFARTVRHIRRDSIDHWFLGLLRQGSLAAGRPHRTVRTPSGAIRVGSLGSEVEGSTTAMDGLYLFVPRDFCRDAASRLDQAVNSNLAGGLGQLLADYLIALERRLPVLVPDELPAVLTTTRSMILACVSPNADRLDQARHAIDATLLERARQLIHHQVLSPELTLNELCRQLGVSRSRLYRLFEPSGGVVRYIRSRRLLDAHAALSRVTVRRPVADIAAERGFLDAADFSRAFKREFGYRPSEVRGGASAIRPERPVVGRHDREGAGFADLLRGLHSIPC